MSRHRSFPRRHGQSLSPFAQRTGRGCRNAQRLGYEASVVAAVHGALHLGIDRDLCGLLADSGLGKDAVAAVRFRGSGREYGVILPTDRTWKRPRLRRLAYSVAALASVDGVECLVVPPRAVRLEPRLANALRIFHRKETPASGDAEAVNRIIETLGGEAPLVDCEAGLDSPRARERIFGLVFGGHLEIDLSTELTGRSAVRLRPPDWTFHWDVLGWHPVDGGPAGPPPPPDAPTIAVSLS